MAQNKKKRIKAEDFVKIYMKVYNDGGDLQDLATKLNISKNALAVRIHSYRKKKIKLPPLLSGRNNKNLDVEALNKLIFDNL